VKRLAFVLALLVVVMSTSVANARERRWSLFGGGLALLLAGWALDVGVTYGVGHEPAATSLIPIFGPLVQMGQGWAMVPAAASGNAQVDAQAQPRIDAANHTIQTAAYAVLAVDFAMQLAGATMVVVGAVGREQGRADRVTVSLAPMPGGAMMRLRF
jgi:predicted membrane protein